MYHWILSQLVQVVFALVGSKFVVSSIYCRGLQWRRRHQRVQGRIDGRRPQEDHRSLA